MQAAAVEQEGVVRAQLTGAGLGDAADILWLYAGPWAYRSFVTGRGWTLDEYEAWIGDTLYHQLMSPEAA
jgi:hypothetical protein